MHAPETSPAWQHLPIVSRSADTDPSVHFSYQKKIKRRGKGNTGSQMLVTSTLHYLVNWWKEGRKGKSRLEKTIKNKEASRIKHKKAEKYLE